jgi:ubiquinone/menaquinone biosynthesis C-methylase UbiE
MNEAHKACGGDEWRSVMRDMILPGALANIDFGDDVLEIGPGYGAATDVVSERVPQLTCVEIDPELAAFLTDRFGGQPHVHVVNADATAMDFADGRFTGAICFTMMHHVPTIELQDKLLAEARRVLKPGGTLVAGDSLASEELLSHHDGDTYNPVDPTTLAARLEAAGFSEVEVTTNPFAWQAVARA